MRGPRAGARRTVGRPWLTPGDRDDELAYWINAYNALVLVTVLEHYPIDSVGDVEAPFPLRPMLWGEVALAGFFVFQRQRLGGELTNLYDLENEVIRAYGEPRIHFAINCASHGCPALLTRSSGPSWAEAGSESRPARTERTARPRSVRLRHPRDAGFVDSVPA